MKTKEDDKRYMPLSAFFCFFEHMDVCWSCGKEGYVNGYGYCRDCWNEAVRI